VDRSIAVDFEVDHAFAIAQPTIVKHSLDTAIVSAGDPCNGHCGR
jgi:hypothetical protein